MTMQNTFGGIRDLTTNPTTAPTCFLMMSVTLVQMIRVDAPDHRPDLTYMAKTNAQLNSCSYTCESIPLHRFHTYCLHSRKAAQDNTDRHSLWCHQSVISLVRARISCIEDLLHRGRITDLFLITRTTTRTNGTLLLCRNNNLHKRFAL